MRASSLIIWMALGLLFVPCALAANDTGMLIGIKAGHDWAIIGQDVELYGVVNGQEAERNIFFPTLLIVREENGTYIEAAMNYVPDQEVEKLVLYLNNATYVDVDVTEYETGNGIAAFRGNVTSIRTMVPCIVCTIE